MRLVSTTLTGNSERTIADALRSVRDLVDQCLVIDTGVTDRTLEVAREVVGDKLVVRKFTWIHDFAAARNFALIAAAQLGADCALTMDTDERLVSSLPDPRGWLEATRADLVYVNHENGSYSKERFFALPARSRWVGPTHEAFPTDGLTTAVMPQVVFSELDKTPAQLEAKMRRDLEILKRHARANPSHPRWFYYLGESHRSLGELDEAIDAYDACAALRGWDEESAWACFRAATCLAKQKCFEEALERCTRGLERHAGIAELAWYAGLLCYELGRDDQAVHWSKMAIVHGAYQGDEAELGRINFRDLIGLYEGPFDVMRWAEKRRGKVEAAAEAERHWKLAKAAREARQG